MIHPLQIRAGFQQALELVSKDAAGEGGQLPEAAGVAEAVEAALYAHHGERCDFCGMPLSPDVARLLIRWRRPWRPRSTSTTVSAAFPVACEPCSPCRIHAGAIVSASACLMTSWCWLLRAALHTLCGESWLAVLPGAVLPAGAGVCV